ncbi:MAG: peptidyl-prolyl cis-trans isomerase [Pseudomonadota bacterium]
MISLFRNFFQSKIGLPIFIGFLVIVAIAFAASDVTGSATFGGLTGDDKVVVIGGESVGANELQGAVNNGLDRVRGQNPTVTMPQFVENGGYEQELELLIDRMSTGLFAKSYGLRAGDNLVNSEILQIQAFRNLAGEFDQEVYQNALRREGITDAILRSDIGDGLLNQQILRPAFSAPTLPRAAARQYAALVLERRRGSIALLPSSAFEPESEPTEEQLAAYYEENRDTFVMPERRTIRVAQFGSDSITAEIVPTEDQIAARFETDAALYAAQERRAVTSFVVPTQDAAQAIVDRIRAGASLETEALDAGFNVQTSELRDRESLQTASSFALAEAVFAAERGAIVEPAQSTLGWYVARVDEIERTPARSFEEVRNDIERQIRVETRAAQLADLSSNIERQLDEGTSLTDVASQYGFEVTAVPDVTEDGTILGPFQGVAQVLRPIIPTAFQMDENEPQLAELVPGAQFMIFDVSQIVDSAAPPIAEVRDGVVAGWRRSKGAKQAKDVADRVLAAMDGESSLREVLRAEGVGFDVAQVEDIDLSREELLVSAQGRIPSALVLMFSMAQGTTKVLEEQADLGWFIVNLENIEAPEVAEENPVLANTQNQIGQALAVEYNAQLSAAIRAEIGVERNEEAIEALRSRLLGEN